MSPMRRDVARHPLTPTHAHATIFTPALKASLMSMHQSEPKPALALAAFAIVLIAALAIGLNIAVWRECRAAHSWWYCVAVLGK